MIYNLITKELLDELDKILNPEVRLQLTEHDTTMLMHNVHQLFNDNNIEPCITELYLTQIGFQLQMQRVSRCLK